MFKSSILAFAVIQLLVAQPSFSAPPAKGAPGAGSAVRPVQPGKPIVAPPVQGKEVMDGRPGAHLTGDATGAASTKLAMDKIDKIGSSVESWPEDSKGTFVQFIGEVQARHNSGQDLPAVIRAGGKDIKVEDFINCK